MTFTGSKAALIFNDQLLVFLRDDTPGLRFRNLWDFPGGGREGEESPFETLNREVQEEFGITLTERAVLWKKEYPAMHDPSERAFFFVINLTQTEIGNVVFGGEGQRWQLMPIDEFLSRNDVVPDLKGRLKDYLDSVRI